MFGFSGAIKFYYCPTPLSMRKSFDGLAGAVEEYIRQDPESGHAFVFFGRSRKMVKILQWQGDGFTIWMKRLESGAFHLPKSAEGGLNCPVENLQRSCPGSNRIAITKDTRKSLDRT